MRVLLDTHALLWFVEGSSELPPNVKALIEAPETEVYVSAASFHELAVKVAKGMLSLTVSLAELGRMVLEAGFGYLPVLPEHADYLARELPPRQEHKDPFDRIMIAQAIVEDLVFVSRDGYLPLYEPALQHGWAELSAGAARPPEGVVLDLDQGDERFWRDVDMQNIEQFEDQRNVPALRRLGDGLRRLMTEYGIAYLEPHEPGAELGWTRDGTLTLHGFKWDRMSPRAHDALGAVEGLDQALLAQKRELSNDELLQAFLNDARSVLLRVAVGRLEGDPGVAFVGFDRNDVRGGLPVFRFRKWRIALLPEDLRQLTARILGIRLSED